MTDDLERPTTPVSPGWSSRRRDLLAGGASLAALVMAAISFAIEAATEPFHVDEIRQVSPYGGTLREIVDVAFGQEQPPLDPLIGAVFQLVLGVGDALQRSSSIVFGLAAMVLVGLLLWRRGMRTAVPVTLFMLAISPTFVSYTAYARPYALPIALMLGFAYGTDLWLDNRTISGGLLATICALALPLSRVFEPPAFLGLTIIVLGIEHKRWGRRIWWPITAAVAALALVELPIYRRLTQAFDKYAESPDRSWSTEWARIIDRSIPELASDFPWPWLTLALVIIAISIPSVRRWLRSLWWFAPLTGAAVAFAIAFHVQTAPPQPYYSRYGYFFVVPVAIIVGQLVTWAAHHLRDQPRRTIPIIALTSILAIVWGIALIDDLNHDTNTDYRALGATIETELPPDTIVIYDSLEVRVGSWRPGFYGKSRYLRPERRVFEPEPLIFDPTLISGTSEVAIALDGRQLTVDGWESIPASSTMTLYVPDHALVDPLDVAQSLSEFADEAPRRTSMLRLAAAALFDEAHKPKLACRQYRLAVESSPARADAVEDITAGSSIADLPERCA